MELAEGMGKPRSQEEALIHFWPSRSRLRLSAAWMEASDEEEKCSPRYGLETVPFMAIRKGVIASTVSVWNGAESLAAKAPCVKGGRTSIWCRFGVYLRQFHFSSTRLHAKALQGTTPQRLKLYPIAITNP